ncbi:MAG: hypothetical protein ACJAR2_000978 [Ilumatobacter sp.]|jgi:hypothetical protein
MTDPSEATEGTQPVDHDNAADTHDSAVDQRKVWSSEELAQLARRMLERRSLPKAAESALLDHPDLTHDAVEHVDDDEFKP